MYSLIKILYLHRNISLIKLITKHICAAASENQQFAYTKTKPQISFASVGKQTLCMLSFVYMSCERARFRTAHTFENLLLKKIVLHISYHMRHIIITK